jgi:hypothetical protein
MNAKRSLFLALLVALAAFGADAAAPGSRPPNDRSIIDGWTRGHWDHGTHDGRFGWWWGVGPNWFYYAQPAYPYPAYPYDPDPIRQDYSPPQAAGIQDEEFWYYCNDPKGFYPYVDECRHDWSKMPITPSFGSAGYTNGGHQYYCNDPAGFYPLVDDCKRQWRIVPAIAPPR